MRPLIVSLLLTTTVPLLAATPPAILNHQGRIAVSGTNHNGTGYFKFAFVDAVGTTTYWSNDGTSNAGSAPTSAVSVTVNNGHYAVGLGDASLTNMTAIPPATFTENDDVHLRIWFSTAMGGPFEQLSPDRRITSVGYALNAGEAQSVADLSITSSMLADQAVTADKLAAGSAGENIDTEGSLGIGLDGSEAVATIQLDGDKGSFNPIMLSSLQFGSGRSHGVFVSDNLAYVADGPGLEIIDVTNLESPVLVGSLFDGFDGFNGLAGAMTVYVSRDIAYVLSSNVEENMIEYFENAISIIDVSETTPVLLSELRDGVGGFNDLKSPRDIIVEGSIAYVTTTADSAFNIIDVSNPSSPSLISVVKDGVGGFDDLGGARSIAIEGNTAYVASLYDEALTLIDISNPASPGYISVFKNGVGGVTQMIDPRDVFIDGTTAYIAASGNGTLTIVDVSNPANPTLISEIEDGIGGFDDMRGAYAVQVLEGRAYVCSQFDDAISIIDVSDPANPSLISVIKDEPFETPQNLNRLLDLRIKDKILYVVGDGRLNILDIEPDVELVTEGRVGIGTSAPDAMLHVEGDAIIAGNLLDSSQNSGFNGQILTNTESGTQWSWLDHGSLIGRLDDDHPQYFLEDGSETFHGELNINEALRMQTDTASTTQQGGRIFFDENNGIDTFGFSLLYAGDSDPTFGGTPFSLPSNRLYFISHEADAAGAPAMAIERSSRDVGIGETNALGRLHIQDSSINLILGSLNNDDLIIEDPDGTLGIYSDGAGEFGSKILFGEVDTGTGDLVDRWTLARKTNAGDVDANSEIQFRFYDGLTGTEKLQLDASGGLGIVNSLQTGSADTSAVTFNRMGTASSVHGMIDSSDLLVSDDLEVIGEGFFRRGLRVGTNDTSNDDFIYFDSGVSRWLKWENANLRFALSNDLHVNGVITDNSDRNLKEGFANVDSAGVLEKVAVLPITTWWFKDDLQETLHLGPMAQDFHAAFGVGSDERMIAKIDADGVALAAIQGLNAKVEASDVDKDARITFLEKENSELRDRLERLESAVEALGSEQ